MSITERQLTLDVHADPRVIPDGLMIGSLKISGEFTLDRDLNRGDTLTVQVASADGEILSTGVAEITGVGFVNVTDKETVLGTERQHKAKLA